jgi:hypothetical protein
MVPNVRSPFGPPARESLERRRAHDRDSRVGETATRPTEGVTTAVPLFVRYRERHPAIIFNLKVRQTVSWTPLYLGGVPKNPPYYG